MIENPAINATYWVANRQRVRAGRGVVAVKCQGLVNANGKVWAIESGRTFYPLTQLFETEQRAKAHALFIAQNELALERERFQTIYQRLQACHKACAA